MSAVQPVGQVMTADRARRLTDGIKDSLSVAFEALIECWQGRADQALGYDSWDAYCAAEFAEARMVRLAREQRREIVGEMRRVGMSTRAIGSGLGIGAATAMRDSQATVSDETEDAVVTGLDGYRQPARQPQPQPEPAPRPTPEAVERHEAERAEQVHRDNASKMIAESVWLLAENAKRRDAAAYYAGIWQSSADIYPEPTTAERMRRAAAFLNDLAEVWHR